MKKLDVQWAIEEQLFRLQSPTIPRGTSAQNEQANGQTYALEHIHDLVCKTPLSLEHIILLLATERQALLGLSGNRCTDFRDGALAGYDWFFAFVSVDLDADQRQFPLTSFLTRRLIKESGVAEEKVARLSDEDMVWIASIMRENLEGGLYHATLCHLASIVLRDKS